MILKGVIHKILQKELWEDVIVVFIVFESLFDQIINLVNAFQLKSILANDFNHLSYLPFKYFFSINFGGAWFIKCFEIGFERFNQLSKFLSLISSDSSTLPPTFSLFFEFF